MNYLNIKDILEKNPEINLDKNEYNINVTSNNGREISRLELDEEYENNSFEGSTVHLYFHYPLCYYICKFCNYVKKSASKESTDIDYWVDSLILESNIRLESNQSLRRANVESIYFGGGTASIMKEDNLDRIINHVKENYSLAEDCEISLEGNPDDFVTLDFERLKKIGINRYSLGVQSLEDNVTEYTNRKHSSEQSILAIKKLRKTGMPFNVDIMFGLPFQDHATVKNDIKSLIELEVPSITIYRFRNSKREKMDIGKKSMWSEKNILNKIDHLFPSLDVTYEHRELIVKELVDNDYYPSPCGWWTKNNTYKDGLPKVSMNKWRDYRTMIAFGPGAYGWITEENGRYIQTHNEINFRDYQESLNKGLSPFMKGRVLEGELALVTKLGFAFKANQPISISFYQNEFGDRLVRDVLNPIVKKLKEKDFIYFLSKDLFRPSLIGEAVHEEIISEIIHGFVKSNTEICKK